MPFLNLNFVYLEPAWPVALSIIYTFLFVGNKKTTKLYTKKIKLVCIQYSLIGQKSISIKPRSYGWSKNNQILIPHKQWCRGCYWIMWLVQWFQLCCIDLSYNRKSKGGYRKTCHRAGPDTAGICPWNCPPRNCAVGAQTRAGVFLDLWLYVLETPIFVFVKVGLAIAAMNVELHPSKNWEHNPKGASTIYHGLTPLTSLY